MKKILSIILTIIILTTFAFAIDISGANAPEVYQGLYPIKYAANGDVMFTSASDPDWFNYANGKWANAVTLDKLGQMDPSTATEANITGYYVWIPRYAYLIRTGYNSSNTGRIDIRFLSGTTNKDAYGNTYSAIDDVYEKVGEKTELTYIGDRQMEYLVHPAFDFEEELTGIWVAKYEASINDADVNRDGMLNDEDFAIIQNYSLNGGYSEVADLDKNGDVDAFDLDKWYGLTVRAGEGVIGTVNSLDKEASKYISLNNAFDMTRNMTSKSENYDKYNPYGFSEEVNTHLIKPTEYGAVVYLANSIYKPLEEYKVNGIESGKEYTMGGLDGSLGVTQEKYKDIYIKDEEKNVIDVKGSVYLETSDGTTAWNNQASVGNALDHSGGIVVKENEYGSIADNGNSTDIGFRVAIAKGKNINKVKQKISKSINNSTPGSSYFWLMDNGEVWVMGNNSYGQLGLGDTTARFIPEKIKKTSDGSEFPDISEMIVSVAFNQRSMTYFLTDTGEVYVSGNNTYGQLGIDDNSEIISSPKKVNFDEDVKIKKVIGGASGSSCISFFIDDNGDIYVAGNNNYGQLGINDSINTKIYKASKVTFDADVKVKAVKYDSTLQCVSYLTEGGDVYVAGNNGSGQLGINDSTNNKIYKATKVTFDEPEPVKVKDVIYGYSNVFYLTEGGDVYAAGNNNSGMLGINDDTNTKIYKATKVPFDEEVTVKEVIYGSSNIYFMTEEGYVYAAGDNWTGQLGVNSTDSSVYKATRVPFDDDELKVSNLIIPQSTLEGPNIYFVLTNGDIYAAGCNVAGELGVNSTAYSVYKPGKIDLGEGIKIKDFIIGYGTIYCLTTDDDVYVCGNNNCGQLGIGSRDWCIYKPEKLDLGENVKIKSVEYNGNLGVYYITKSGDKYAAGNNYDGDLGVDSTEEYIYKAIPVKVKTDTTSSKTYTYEYSILKNVKEKVKDIEFGLGSAMFLTETGRVYGTGVNTSGSLGIGDVGSVRKVTQSIFDEGIRIKEVINAAVERVYYLTEDGDVYASGDNSDGILGIESTEENISIPQKIPFPEPVKIKKIIKDNGIEMYSMFFLTEEGDVYVLGYNPVGELGINNTEYLVNRPTKVVFDEDIKVKDMVYGYSNIYYITYDGDVYAVGANNSGELGVDSTSTTVLKPEKVVLDPEIDVEEIVYCCGAETSTLETHSSVYFFTTDGEVYAAGDNTYGQLGINTTVTAYRKPIKVDLGTGIKIKEIIYKEGTTYYLTTAKDVYAAGLNEYGQLGINSSAEYIIKAQKIDLGTGIKVKKVIYNNYSLYLLTTGNDVYVAGSNSNGKLGINSTTSEYSKTQKVNLGTNIKIQDVIAETDRVYYLTTDEEVYAAGSNSSGKLGINSTSSTVRKATKVPITENVKRVICSSDTVFFIIEKGTTRTTAYAAGSHSYGKLGINSMQYGTKREPKEVYVFSEIKDIVFNGNSTYFITESGYVYVAGNNSNGELGTGTTDTTICNPRSPSFTYSVETIYANVSNITSIYGNAISTVLENETGEIYVVGDNTNNKLGITGEINVATKINITGVKDVGIGNDFSVFLKDDGSIVGYGNISKTGNGLTGISQIAVQNNKAYFMKADGTVIDNQNNVIATDAYKIAAGANHLSILKKDGIPQVIGQIDPGLTDVVDIFAGKNMTVYVMKNDEVYMVTDNTKELLDIRGIVYAELNGKKPYFVTYDRDLIDIGGNPIKAAYGELQWVKEVKGDVVLNERMIVYDLNKL